MTDFETIVFLMKTRQKADLLIRHNPEHLGAAIRASTGHCSALGAALALKRCFVGIFHHSLGLALDAVCFNLSHNYRLMLIFAVYLIYAQIAIGCG